jgi:hypothetical protein
LLLLFGILPQLNCQGIIWPRCRIGLVANDE